MDQEEADHLLNLEKIRVDDRHWRIPLDGRGLVIQLASTTESENFILDLSKNKINLKRGKIQNRARSTIILARIDFGGAPHCNPDGNHIPCPHIHLYREGFDDKWAFPIQSYPFYNIDDYWNTLDDFMRFCKIIKPPIFDRTLFT